MSTTKPVPAFSELDTGWHSINWRLVHRQVRGLQVRIAKATERQQWRRVKTLQRLLVRSFAAKALAVKRVTDNRGKGTPGVDDILWDTPNAKWDAIANLSRTGYRPRPLRRVHIPKANGKSRPLGIPTMHDRAMQALYLLALEPVSEFTADRNSYGFRPQRSTADAIEQCFVNFSRKSSAEWVLEGDIKACFDNISHDWLLTNIPMDRQVLRKWLRCGYMESGHLSATLAGTPQGGIISPVLANMALDGLEGVLESHFGHKNTKASYKTKVNYVRYADDFVISGISQELLKDKVFPVVEAFMAKRGLALSPEKTLISHIKDGFDFLGQNARKYNGKLLIKPARKSVKSLLQKVKRIVRQYATVEQSVLIYQLNPVLRGWSAYHRHVVSAETFKYVDYRVWKLLWRWCCRRHKNRRKRWVKKRYFRRKDGYEWNFRCTDPLGREAVLHRLSSVNIKRHIKIRSEANLYRSDDETYFEKRVEYRWKMADKERQRVTWLWNRQGKRCPICSEFITQETGWDVHHILERHRGGKDCAENLVLLHPNCHRQLHNMPSRWPDLLDQVY